MSSLGKAGLAAILFSVILWTGCNDAFRPIVIPIAAPGPDPQQRVRTYALSTNGAGLGAVTTIDVPGDTATSIQYAGHGAVDLSVLPGGASAFVVNQVDETLTQISPGNLNQNPVTIPLPAGSGPLFAFSSIGDRMYVTEPGRKAVAMISASTLTLQTEVPVGNNPVAMTEMPNGQKLYVLNQADNTVTVIQTANNTILGTIPVGLSPVAATVSTDGLMVFVANEGSGDVTVIDTTNDTAALGTIPLGASPGCGGTFPCYAITYDSNLKRVYTANRANNTISVIRADQSPPTLPTLLTPAPGVDVTAAPCNGSSPRQVAVPPDGSRAYVVNHDTDNVCVLSSLSNTFSKSIALPAGAAPTSVAASLDNTKVYTANPGTQNISIIATSSDSIVSALKAPKTDPNCQDPAPPAPPVCIYMTPVYVTPK
jgi:YVTN family beta-propeller protein